MGKQPKKIRRNDQDPTANKFITLKCTLEQNWMNDAPSYKKKNGDFPPKDECHGNLMVAVQEKWIRVLEISTKPFIHSIPIDNRMIIGFSFFLDVFFHHFLE